MNAAAQLLEPQGSVYVGGSQHPITDPGQLKGLASHANLRCVNVLATFNQSSSTEERSIALETMKGHMGNFLDSRNPGSGYLLRFSKRPVRGCYDAYRGTLVEDSLVYHYEWLAERERREKDNL